MTMASCHKDMGGGMISYMLYGDFSQRIFVTHPKRVTERAVRQQHEQALVMLDEIRTAALAFYTIPENAAKAA